MNIFFRGTLIFMFLFSFLYLAEADEVTDSLDEAMKQYKKDDYVATLDNIDYAAQLVRQKRVGSLEAFLPEALPGWVAEVPTSQTLSTAMFGGGVFVERKYVKDYSVVTIKIATDSPMLQGVMSMFSNQMFLTASGGKIERVKGQRAIVNYDPKNGTGEIKIIVANRILVTVSGQAVSRSDLDSYANGVDYSKLNSLF